MNARGDVLAFWGRGFLERVDGDACLLREGVRGGGRLAVLEGDRPARAGELLFGIVLRGP